MSTATNVIEFNAARKPGEPLIADIDNGYCKVANDIQDRIYQLDVSGACHQLLQAIIRHTYGYNKTSDRFTNTFLQELTGLGETAVKVGLKTLIERKIILVTTAGKMKILQVNRLVSDWQMKAQNRPITGANAPDAIGRKSAPYQAQTRPLTGANPPDNRRKRAPIKDNYKDNYKDNIQKTDQDENAPAVRLDYSGWPVQPSQQVFSDWKKLRTAKKAPLTQTAINRLAKELHAAAAAGYSVDDCLTECITRGWSGFEFKWLTRNGQPVPQHKFPQTFADQQYRSEEL